MRFWKVDDLEHENKGIYYNRQYSGNLYLGDEENYKTYPIRFRIEKDVFGEKIENIEISGNVDYPLIELYSKIKEYIRSQLWNGNKW